MERPTTCGLSSVGRAVRLVLIGSGLLLADAQICAAQEAPASPVTAGPNGRTGATGTQPSAAQTQSDQVAEIVVTGTRIALPAGATSPTPTTVVNAATMQEMGLPNVGDMLNQLPSFLNNGEPTQSTALSPANIGSRIVNLRGLGAGRTLVLVDGRRFVPSTATGTVDLNLIPSALVERTEIVTGGASAAYGSDAVAGVVNILLNSKLQGIQSQVQYGISQEGDNQDVQASLAGGTD